MRADDSPRPVPAALLGAALFILGCDAGQTDTPSGPVPDFRLTFEAEGAAPAELQGDSTAWRNEGSPYHRVFRLVLHAPAAPAGFPEAPVEVEVAGYGGALAGGSVPAPGTWPVEPGSSGIGTSVRVEIGPAWQGTAVSGVLVVESADPEIVSGSLDVELAVHEDLEPRPAVTLRGRFTAAAWAE